MGFGKIFWGFLFFFDFRIQGFDILPDIIGYWLIYSGLKELVSMSSHFAAAQKYAVVLGGLSVFDLYQITMPIQQFSIGPLTGLLILMGIIVTILDLLMVYNLCHGIAEMANGRGLSGLKTVALNRWEFYLYLRIATGVAVPLAILIPQLVIILLIPLIGISILLFILMMGLMRQAEEVLGWTNLRRRKLN